jgi:hypothetical protein
VVTPLDVDERLNRQDLVAVQDQRAEERALQGRTEAQRAPLGLYRDRPEHPEDELVLRGHLATLHASA